jgi:hypothetical protein
VYGVPVYDPAETYTAYSFTNRNGILYKSLQGSNSGNLPETAGSTYWQDTRAARTQTVSASGSLVLGGFNWEILVDLSLGGVTISQLPVPDFIGQRVHVYGTGTGLGKITGGTGLYMNGVYFNSATNGVFLEAKSATLWNVVPGISAEVTGTQHKKFYSDGRMELSRQENIVSFQTKTFETAFVSAPEMTGVSNASAIKVIVSASLITATSFYAQVYDTGTSGYVTDLMQWYASGKHV